MKHQIAYIIIVVLTFYACQEHQILDNSSTIQHIDSLACTKQKLTLKIGQTDQEIDTIQISEIKESKTGVKLYQRNIDDNGETISEFYFWQDDGEPFLTITNNSKIDLHITVELFKNSKGNISQLLVTEGSNEKIDTFISTYVRTRNIFGNLKTIETTSNDDIRSISIYEKGKVVLDLIVMESDTTKRTKYKYINDQLESSETYSYLGDSTVKISKFNDTKLSSTKLYKTAGSELIPLSESNYSYDKQNNLISYISMDYKRNIVDSLIIKYEPCD